MRSASWFALAVGLSGAPVALGSAIQTPANAGGHLVAAHSPIGQTFTAEDPRVSVGLYVWPAEGLSTPDRSLLVELFAGHGVHGPRLDARTLTPAVGFRGYLDVDYGEVATLTPGDAYTVTLRSSARYWVSGSSASSYPGGVAVITGVLEPNLSDKAFRVIPVPEPIAVAPAAVLALAMRHRRHGPAAR